MGLQFRKLVLAATALITMVQAGCSTVEPKNVAELARPDRPPTASVTQFEQPLQCMDRLFAEYGVSDITVAISGVPDYTGKVFVGSDFWLQTAIAKMSQRSRAFKITDYNPNSLLPEQGLWDLSDKAGFYIPAYYIRGAVSGFADNVVDNRTNVGISDGVNGGSIGASSSYSMISVDLSVGMLSQRTLINRAHAGNEVVLTSRASGAQLGGILSKFGANVEIVAGRKDGVPHAVRALVELDAIEILGRLTATPYWQCLGGAHADDAAVQAREDIFYDMSEAERAAFVQRRLTVLGYFHDAVDGQSTPQLAAAIAAYRKDRKLAPGGLNIALYNRMSDWKSDPVAAQVAATAPAKTQASPAVLPLPSKMDPDAKALDLNLVLLRPNPAPGAPVSLTLRPNQPTYAYCYIQEASGAISRIFPNRWQPDPLLKGDAAVSVPPGTPGSFNLLLPPKGVSETVVCFGSSVEIGARLPDAMRTGDLKPMSVTSISELTKIYRSNVEALKGAFVTKQAALAPSN